MGPDFLEPDQLDALEGMDHSLFMVAGVQEAADWRAEGILESLLTMPDGGCAGALAVSSSYYLFLANQFYEGFWSGLAEGTADRVGDVYRQTLETRLQAPYADSASGLATLECFGVAGDPALLFWPAESGSLNRGRVAQPILTAAASPNPFNPTTVISFVVPGETGIRLPAVVEIFDLAGRRMIRILETDLAPGSHSVRWRGQDDSGRKVGAGLFFARIKVGNAQAVVKLVMVE